MKTTTALIIIVVIALVVFGGWWWFSTQKEDVRVPLPDGEWQTYTNDMFGFGLSYPPDWEVFEDNTGLTPIINVFPKNTAEQPPFIHHHNVTMVSIFPHGVPTEGIVSDNALSQTAFTETPVLATDFLLEDGTVWATYAAFGQQAPNWEESGFVFGRDRILGQTSRCLRDGAPVAEDSCDPFTGDTIHVSGTIDADTHAIVEAILTSFHFTKDITEVRYGDFVRLTAPLPHTVIQSPLVVKGEARGPWFFEGSFPLFLTDWDGKIIAQGYVTAQSDPDASVGASWMTTDYVPFEGMLTFETPSYGDTGALILRKDNPSGLPEFDDAFEIRVRYR